MWTRVFSTRRWVILVARTRRKKKKKIAWWRCVHFWTFSPVEKFRVLACIGKNKFYFYLSYFFSPRNRTSREKRANVENSPWCSFIANGTSRNFEQIKKSVSRSWPCDDSPFDRNRHKFFENRWFRGVFRTRKISIISQEKQIFKRFRKIT